jgi:hypothetical protein
VQPVAHQTLFRVHRTLSGAQAEAPRELVALGFSQSHSTKNHWTVRCATGLSGEPTEGTMNSAEVRTHRTIWCRKRTKDFNGQPLQTPTVGGCGTHRTMNSVMSGAPPDCPLCPSITTARIVVGAINTPNHHHSSHSSF